MSQQHLVGSIDPFAHTSSNQPNTGAPSRVASETAHGSIHHAASPSIGGEAYQQSQSHSQSQVPLNPSSTPTTITMSTTTATSTTPARKPSLTDTLIASASTAATTATHAATNAVAAARRLVGNGKSTEIDLDEEVTDTVKVEETSSSKGGLLNFMKPSINNGLEFSRRRLSSNKNKTHSSSHPVSSEAPGPGPVPVPTLASAPTSASGVATASSLSSVPSMHSSAPPSAPNTMSTDTTMHAITTDSMHPMSDTVHPTSNTVHPTMQTPIYSSENAVHPSMPAPAPAPIPAPIPAQSYEPAPTGITFSEKQSIPLASTNDNNSNIANMATAASTNPIPRKGSIVGQTAVLTEPHNTIYVTRQGGSRSQALGVDQPSISSTTATVKSQTPTGLGVDKPVYVGVHEDPKTQARRRGSLHVDKMPVFADNALNDVHDKEQNSYTGNLVEASPNAVNGKLPVAAATAPLNDSTSRRRRSSFNGLNVDQPTVATRNVAGSGSTDSTNRNRPNGIYNSGYNVDRPGHHDQKKSGFGVDKPAIVTHQMAAVNKPQQQQPQQQQLFNNTNTTTTTTDSHSHSPTFNKLHNPANSSIHPYSTTTTVSETQVNPAELGPTITYQQTPSSGLSSSAPVDPLIIPANYNGPIPQVAPGEHVIWVKKTVVQTEYYDGAHDNAGGLVPPVPVQESGNQNRRGSSGSFLDRIRGRRASAVSIDKGKQRV